MEQYLEAIMRLPEKLKPELPIQARGKKEIKKGVFVSENTIIESNVFFDASSGDIAIGDGTRVKANSILRGPLIVGKDCVINSFAEISCSRIGDVCKIGGEVEGCIIQNYSNKQHYGYLGHSYIGSWVNIGAGTSVSDLKNTYSSIKVGGRDTGELKLGAIIGDYVKTAINTSIFCGKVIGPSAHLYGTVTLDIPAFTSHVAPGEMFELPIEIALRIQRAMTGRRGVEFTKSDDEKMRLLFAETQSERDQAGVKKEKLSFR